jgi:hypothetical protein
MAIATCSEARSAESPRKARCRSRSSSLGTSHRVKPVGRWGRGSTGKLAIGGGDGGAGKVEVFAEERGVLVRSQGSARMAKGEA